jgi:hypothetical protein
LEVLSLFNVITNLNVTAFEEIGEVCVYSNTHEYTFPEGCDSMTECLARGMTLYLTDGLSRLLNNMLLLATVFRDSASLVPDGQRTTMSDLSVAETDTTVAKPQDPSRYQLLKNSAYSYEYGWGLQDGQVVDFTMIFRATVLLLHLLLALVHIAIAIYSDWRSNSRGKLGELLALAINPAPTPALQNTCARISRSETWSQVCPSAEDHEEVCGAGT